MRREFAKFTMRRRRTWYKMEELDLKDHLYFMMISGEFLLLGNVSLISPLSDI